MSASKSSYDGRCVIEVSKFSCTVLESDAFQVIFRVDKL